jgi:hypothetical protein
MDDIPDSTPLWGTCVSCINIYFFAHEYFEEVLFSVFLLGLSPVFRFPSG